MTESTKTAKKQRPKRTSQKSFDNAKGEEFDPRPRIGLLLGNDVSALEVANITVKNLHKAGYRPVLYMTAHRPSAKENAHQLELQNLGFYERYLTNNVMYPIIESMPTVVDENGQGWEDILYTPQQLADIYDLELEHVDDINDPEFVKQIRDDKRMPLVVSCRCYQIAHDALIEAQTKKKAEFRNGRKQNGEIWNLHPGKLPEYRGIFGPIFAMNNQQRTYRWTLHGMIYDGKAKRKGIDAGPIMTSTSRAIDYTKPAVQLYTHIARDAGKMLYDRIEDFFGGTVPLTATPQASLAEKGRKDEYYTHPDPDFFEKVWPTALQRLADRGDEEGFFVPDEVRSRIKAGDAEPEIVNPDMMADHLLQAFRPEGADERKRIRGALSTAIMHWEGNKHMLHAHHNAAMHENQGLVDSYLMSGNLIHRGPSNGNGHDHDGGIEEPKKTNA